MNIPALAEFETDGAAVELLLRKLGEYKLSPDLWIERGSSATTGGIQTKNVLTFGDNELTACLDLIKSRLEGAMGVRLNYFWAHMIEYDSGGSQEMHSHEHNEDVSFVLYLNDCEGGRTRFVLNEKRDVSAWVRPRRGGGAVFLASLRHYAEACEGPKQVLVGGLRLM